MLGALDDPSATVRFSLVGALAHAAGDGSSLGAPQRERLLARLEALLERDADPGVRSRAATVLGECGPPAALQALWRRVQAAEDGRVQEKSWAALIEIVVRSDGQAARVDVRDDGVGGADPATGTGLRGLADRVDALGGVLLVASPDGEGTTVTAVIPCGS